MIKKAWAVWKGGIKDGGGTIPAAVVAACGRRERPALARPGK